MEVKTHNGKRKLPTSPSEYFVALYCKRRKLKPVIGPAGGMTVWKSLGSAEKEAFKEKFEKWQEENDKKMFRVLENAEPFLKKKATINTENVESHMTGTDFDYDENQSIINISEKTNDNISNADLEVTKQENIDAESHTSERDDYNDYQAQPVNVRDIFRTNDNMSNAGSEVSNQYYAGSVIDRDTDEPIAQQETQIIEPIPPTNLKPKELFERIKSNGTLPELATVEWKDLTAREKRLYRNAADRIKKDYLIKYEKYLHSLSDSELFKHWIKTLEN